jgi:AI-2 transport protein TqsA
MISPDNSILRTFHFIAVIIIILVGIVLSQNVIELILLALFIAIITLHPILLLEKKKVPYTLAIVIVLSSISLLFLVFGAIVGGSVSKFMSDLPLYSEKLTKLIAGLITSLNDLGMNINEKLNYY